MVGSLWHRIDAVPASPVASVVASPLVAGRLTWSMDPTKWDRVKDPFGSRSMDPVHGELASVHPVAGAPHFLENIY